MYVQGGELVLSPTDLTKHLGCRHLTQLDLAMALHQRPAPASAGEELELIFRKGLEHERQLLATLQDRGLDVVSIDTSDVAVAAEATERAMRAGAAVVYQATFLAPGRRGHADFVLRVDTPSALGDWSYEVADTKLARRLKVAALLQLADYAEHLDRLQGHPPERLIVVGGDGVERAWRYSDVAAYGRRVRRTLELAVVERPATRPDPVEHCAQCRYAAECTAQWWREDHLSLVAFMRGDHREALELAGIPTVRALAAARAEDLPVTIGRSSRERLVAQARLQVRERDTGIPVYELLGAERGLGLLRLPTPDPGDLYLDFEGDPFAEDGQGIEVVIGEVRHIDPGKRTVTVDSRDLAADHLVVALGADWATDRVPGLADQGHTFATLPGAQELAGELGGIERGRIVVVAFQPLAGSTPTVWPLQQHLGGDVDGVAPYNLGTAEFITLYYCVRYCLGRPGQIGLTWCYDHSPGVVRMTFHNQARSRQANEGD